MIFGFSSKKQKPKKPAQVGSCPLCLPSETTVTESPFQCDGPQLTDGFHEYVYLGRCKHCGSLALRYSADIFDDYWVYWCLIDESERAWLLAPDSTDDKGYLESAPERARKIIERHPTLIHHPVRGYEWAPSGTPVITGPPW
jgi:hypothetical protein